LQIERQRNGEETGRTRIRQKDPPVLLFRLRLSICCCSGGRKETDAKPQAERREMAIISTKTNFVSSPFSRNLLLLVFGSCFA
jgi:hypothetical protein